MYIKDFFLNIMLAKHNLKINTRKLMQNIVSQQGFNMPEENYIPAY